MDKGWIELSGQPLVALALAALAPQVGARLIVANRHLDRYRTLGVSVVCDATVGHEGPLAGLLAALAAAPTPWLLIVPVDAWVIPADLAARLAAALKGAAKSAAVVRLVDGRLPVCALLPCTAKPALQACFDAGERSLSRALDAVFGDGLIEVAFADWAPEQASLNTPQQLAAQAFTVPKP